MTDLLERLKVQNEISDLRRQTGTANIQARYYSKAAENYQYLSSNVTLYEEVTTANNQNYEREQQDVSRQYQSDTTASEQQYAQNALSAEIDRATTMTHIKTILDTLDQTLIDIDKRERERSAQPPLISLDGTECSKRDVLRGTALDNLTDALPLLSPFIPLANDHANVACSLRNLVDPSGAEQSTLDIFGDITQDFTDEYAANRSGGFSTKTHFKPQNHTNPSN